jgi:hypothetical protein
MRRPRFGRPYVYSYRRCPNASANAGGDAQLALDVADLGFEPEGVVLTGALEDRPRGARATVVVPLGGEDASGRGAARLARGRGGE